MIGDRDKYGGRLIEVVGRGLIDWVNTSLSIVNAFEFTLPIKIRFPLVYTDCLNQDYLKHLGAVSKI